MKDERSDVNHIASNACTPYAEDSKGKALSEAMQIFLFASRSSQSRWIITLYIQVCNCEI